MTTDLAQVREKELAFNFAELENSLREMTAKYAGLIVTEDGIVEAKRDRADLNRMSKAINDAKIRVKKAWMQPYTEFENKCKRLIALCSVPSQAIDAQIKAFEEKEKAEKKALLETKFLLCAGDAAEFITYDDVADPKWLNKTVTIEEAYLQMADTVERYREDAQEVLCMTERCDAAEKLALTSAYRSTKNLAAVLTVKEEIARLRGEEAAKPIMEQAQEPTAQTKSQAQSGTEQKEVRFWVRGTSEQLSRLKGFLLNNGMTYGRA